MSPINSQIKLKTYSNKIATGYEYLADNNEYSPVSVKVDFVLNNMKSSKGNHKIFVVPTRTKGFVITILKMSKPGRYSSKTKFNNVIVVYYKDGSFSSYAHIDTNGALVSVGEKVKENQLIAKSGNIGWSSGPHLHFVVFNQKMNKKESIKTKFKVGNGDQSIYLEEKEKYYKGY